MWIVLVATAVGLVVVLYGVGVRRAESVGPSPLPGNRLREMCMGLLREKHRAAMVCLGLLGCILVSGPWYAWVLIIVASVPAGNAWACLRTRRMGIEMTDPVRLPLTSMPGASRIAQTPAGVPRLELVTAKVFPLPWWVDLLIVCASYAIGAAVGVGASALTR